MLDLTISPRVNGLVVAAVEVRGVQLAPAGEDLQGFCREVADRAAAANHAGGDERRTAVRQLLRDGGYKPSGRNKPAQEYLLRTVNESGALPSILNAVDLINAVSLDGGLPISLVSLDKLGEQITFRYGEPGERFVFNAGGQELDVAGLICLCQGDEGHSVPVGSPVKDSMAAKVGSDDQHLLAAIYAPGVAVETAELAELAEALKRGFVDWCGATEGEAAIVSGTG